MNNENQGKSQKQIQDSEFCLSVALIGLTLIVTLLLIVGAIK